MQRAIQVPRIRTTSKINLKVDFSAFSNFHACSYATFYTNSKLQPMKTKKFNLEKKELWIPKSTLAAKVSSKKLLSELKF